MKRDIKPTRGDSYSSFYISFSHYCSLSLTLFAHFFSFSHPLCSTPASRSLGQISGGLTVGGIRLYRPEDKNNMRENERKLYSALCNAEQFIPAQIYIYICGYLLYVYIPYIYVYMYVS